MSRRASLGLLAVVVARQQRQLVLAVFATAALSAQLVDFGAKSLDVLEAAVNRSESYITYFIQMPQFLHHHFTDAARCDFPLAETAQLVADPRDRSLDGIPADGPLLQRFLHPV
jgi:hypothetical protein